MTRTIHREHSIFFFFKQKTAYEIGSGLVGSEMCIRDSYRGTRHRKKLPVRGQRTRCNARTRKGKAIAIAGKKLTPTKK